MRAFWRKYFHIPSEGHIPEPVFLARLSVDVCLILLYLACMAYAAYALFTSATVVAQ